MSTKIHVAWFMFALACMPGCGSAKVEPEMKEQPSPPHAPPAARAEPNEDARASAVVMTERIGAESSTLQPRLPRGWWLRVTWRVHNLAEGPLWLLVTGVHSLQDTDPLVLDHTAHATPPPLDMNQEKRFRFVKIPGHGFYDLEEQYPLPAWEMDAPRSVLARFGVGRVEPDEAWVSGLLWSKAAAWQRVIESAPFELRTR